MSDLTAYIVRGLMMAGFGAFGSMAAFNEHDLWLTEFCVVIGLLVGFLVFEHWLRLSKKEAR